MLSGLLAFPTLAAAGSGGSAAGGLPGSSGSGAPKPSNTHSVQASGDGITLTTTANTMLRGQLTFSGTASRQASGRTIQIQRLGHQTAWHWTPTVQTTVAPDGSFRVTWHTNHIGRFSVRALFAGHAGAAAAPPTVTITIYRASLATLYGPGFYGRRTACGTRLRRTTIGVANRTLRCGTKVAILYRGRTLVVSVIDRGPYANGADWDLTMATGRALRISTTARIGAVSLPRHPGLF